MAYDIAEDEFIPGNLLFADSRSLKTTDGTTTSHIAGAISKSYGYIDGVGANARFFLIISMIQLSISYVIVADYHNHCLRSVDRTTNLTSTYSGNCTNRGDRDGVDALFTRPRSIILDLMNSQQLIISEYHSGSLKTVNIVRKHVSTMYRSSYSLRNLLQDPSTGNIYVAFEQGLGLYDYQGNTFSIITGSRTTGFEDGEFSQLRFFYPQGLVFLSRSTLLVVDHFNDRLRVLDLTTNTSSSICSGVRGHSDGDLSSCQLDRPWSLLKVNDTVYVGQSRDIRSIQGKYSAAQHVAKYYSECAIFFYHGL